MTKPENEWTWKEIPVGNVVLEPGNASQYRTGDWKSLKPVLNKELCIHCGLCAERCPTAAWDMQKSFLEFPQAVDYNGSSKSGEAPCQQRKAG